MSEVFGITISKPPSCVVIDKSFLDGVNSAQLQFYVQNGWSFAMPEVLMYEHFRKRDERRIANIFKLHRVEKSLFRLPGIGEMFRKEGKTLKPAITTLRAKTIEFIIRKEPSGEYFKLDGESLMQTEERSEQLVAKVPMMIHVWQSLRELPAIKNASPKRSGLGILNSAISGNSGQAAGPRQAWREGVFGGQEIRAAHPPQAQCGV